MNNLDNVLSIIGNENLLLKMAISTFEAELRKTLKLLESRNLFRESIFKFHFERQLDLLLKMLVQDSRAKLHEKELEYYCQILRNGYIDYFKLHGFLLDILHYYCSNISKEITIQKLT